MNAKASKTTVLDRFLRYVKIDTQSKEDSEIYPSTEKQKVLLRLLVDELGAIGLADAAMDEHGYVMATIPATTKKPNVPVIGLIAHVDTSPEMPGEWTSRSSGRTTPVLPQRWPLTWNPRLIPPPERGFSFPWLC